MRSRLFVLMCLVSAALICIVLSGCTTVGGYAYASRSSYGGVPAPRTPATPSVRQQAQVQYRQVMRQPVRENRPTAAYCDYVNSERIVLPRGYSQGVWNEFTNDNLNALIAFCEKVYGIDRFLTAAVIKVESNFDPYAVSSAGARGLMQLMPGTARSLGVVDCFDPAQNIAGGTLYLAKQIREFGDLSLALAAYNAGPGAVRRHGGVPPCGETKGFVQRVTQYYRRYAGK